MNRVPFKPECPGCSIRQTAPWVICKWCGYSLAQELIDKYEAQDPENEEAKG